MKYVVTGHCDGGRVITVPCSSEPIAANIASVFRRLGFEKVVAKGPKK